MAKTDAYSDKIATMIASTSFNCLIIALWSYIACVNPTIYFYFGNSVFFLFIFWFNILYYKTTLNKYIFYPSIFIFMFSVDYIIRKYGDGYHDQVGQALCDITFIVAFACIALSMFLSAYISYCMSTIHEIKDKKILFLKEVVYIVINIIIFFLLFVLLSIEFFTIT